MTPRPSSPTSLLWAHQLKREHGYLLKRMQDLEASGERQAKRIKTAETAAKSGPNADLAALAKQIKALDESGVASRLSKLETDMRHKTEDLEAGTEAITMQVAAMQKDAEALDDEKKKSFTKEKALLKRIGEIESGLKTYEQSLVQMGRRVNEQSLEQIKGQLDGLSKQVVREGDQMKMLAESVTVLEAANEELKKSNQKLATELEAVAARPAVTKSTLESDTMAGAEDVDESPTVAVGPRKARKKKPHKWSGGGADRDIIMSGTQMFGTSAVTAATKKQPVDEEPEHSEDEAPTTKRIRVPPKPKQKYKPTPPHLRTKNPGEPANPKKSHKWSGGGTDKDILRSGRGWVEVADSPDAEDQSVGATHRPQLQQPKKRIATPRWTIEEAMTQGRPTRRARGGRPDVVVEVGDSPKRAAPLAPPPNKASARTTKAASKPTLATALSQKRRPEQNLFTSSSVIGSPPAPQQQHTAQPARKRRRILQDD